MPVTVSWDNEAKTIILIGYDRPWTWQEFEAAYIKMDGMFNSIPHKTSLVLDISRAGFPPPSAIPHFRRVSETQHTNLDRIVVVGIPSFFRSMLSILRNVYQGRYEEPTFLFAPTLDAARQLLTNSIPHDK